jgi:predicted cupin superfamily sugar epimerase
MNLLDPRTDPDAVIAALDLAPHPEGGWYRETWRDAPARSPPGSASPRDADSGRTRRQDG